MELNSPLNNRSQHNCSSECNCQPKLSRRDALQVLGAGVAASAVVTPLVMAGPFQNNDANDHLIPADKKLTPQWRASLIQRGEPEVFSGEQLKYIGMPVGGIGCGQLYISGDGRLWLWDIFKCNYTREPDHNLKIDSFTFGGHYAKPVTSQEEYSSRNGADVIQQFQISATTKGDTQTKELNQKGFPSVTFRGEYPIGRVTYVDDKFPLEIQLEAFSPFIPLNARDSAIPATVLSYTVTNASQNAVDVNLLGIMQNAVCPYTFDAALGNRKIQRVHGQGQVSLLSTAEPAADGQLRHKNGFGSMTLCLLHGLAEEGLSINAYTTDEVGDDNPQPLKEQESIVKPLDEPLLGSLSAEFRLKPGQSRTIDFAVTWYFPDYNEQVTGKGFPVKGFENLRRHYAPWFDSAAEVANYLDSNKTRLLGDTRLWNKTWYDSTLPWWLLDRSFISLDCIASQTFHWFDSGRVYAWEGVDCCGGTCTHVWHYAQALARIFPELERVCRSKVDFNPEVSFNKETGGIAYRGEAGRKVAIDGQAGTILRAYREHLMSQDDSFLRPLWPNVKQAVAYLISQDPDRNGLLEGKQSHTLDASWFGPMGWLSGLYLAALEAGEAMAKEMDDIQFAANCRTIIDSGYKNITSELFNGEYFIHKPDPAKKSINTNRGCHIDQVLGQAWVEQVGLGRVIPKKETVSALESLWRYNFAPDAGAYALQQRDIEKAFRWYAMEGEAGLLMCTWPNGGAMDAIPGKGLRPKANPEVWDGPGGYFNECMNGFEYQVAAHMIYESEPEGELAEKGLAITKAVHERYGATKRNPYNEIECGDHYARSMASYGVFLAACGFYYNGPKGEIGFAPRITPNSFRTPFTAAQGWGTFSQDIVDNEMMAKLTTNSGKVTLTSIRLNPKTLKNSTPKRVIASLAGAEIQASSELKKDFVLIRFAEAIEINQGQTLQIELS